MDQFRQAEHFLAIPDYMLRVVAKRVNCWGSTILEVANAASLALCGSTIFIRVSVLTSFRKTIFLERNHCAQTCHQMLWYARI